MEQKINIAELLKDCPKGMELDCTTYNDVTFLRVDETQNRCYFKMGRADTFWTTCDGRLNYSDLAKCVIFPKGKTTWEGFIPPSKFKDGDVLANQSSMGTWIGIYHRHDYINGTFSSYCSIIRDGKFRPNPNCGHYYYETRLATEEEKEKLFKAIEDNGYRWNPETKTLEKLCPFNAGDVLVSSGGNIVLFSHIDDRQIIYFHCILYPLGRFRIVEETDCGVGGVHNCKLATDKQRDKLFDRLQKSGYKYNSQTNKLEKLIVPKFKVGDKVKSIFNNCQYIITKLTDTHYTLVEVINKFQYTEPIIEDKNWELVPNKFDINTLKPFESRVLVRNVGAWSPALWGYYAKECGHPFVVVGGYIFAECVPYEGNEHLLGTTDDCDEYYKTWE